jgi:hypothetical protein
MDGLASSNPQIPQIRFLRRVALQTMGETAPPLADELAHGGDADKEQEHHHRAIGQRFADVALHQPDVMNDSQQSGHVNASVQALPVFAQPFLPAFSGGERQRQ